MKRIYIKPETEAVLCVMTSMIADSNNGTDWNIGNDDDGNKDPVPIPGPGGGGGNPNEDAKQFNLWDDWE